MNRDEFLSRLKKHEWTDFECKKAQGGVPDAAYDTVSAFANTTGGYLVFGVQEKKGVLEIVGVSDVDKVQNDFLSCLRAGAKLNHPVSVREESIEYDGKTILIFYIEEARRKEKPIYLNGDIKKSYIRRGAGDEKATPVEIERFLRDSSDKTYDTELLLDLDVEDFYDPATVNWYRHVWRQRNADRHAEYSDVEFLHEWGFVMESSGQLHPTRAAGLLFGKPRVVRGLLPRGVVDYQRIDIPYDKWDHEQRWSDRVVLEENILHAWQTLVDKYLRLADSPFVLEASTMRRVDDPPDYVSFREAAINLLIHQDFGDLHRKPVIKIFKDRTVFWNPGDSFANVELLLDPVEKEVRNPSIVAAFRRIGLSDQAGTGIRSAFRNWANLGFVPPRINNSKENKSFEIILVKEALASEEQLLFQAQLGVRLTQQQAAIFSFLCKTGKINLFEAKAVTGKGTSEVLNAIDFLKKQQLVTELEDSSIWTLSDHLEKHFIKKRTIIPDKADLVTDQPSKKSGNMVTDQARQNGSKWPSKRLTKLTPQQASIIKMCSEPRSQAFLMNSLGVTHRDFFRKTHLKPLMEANLVRMSFPDEPKHPNQTYVLTDAGKKLLASQKTNFEHKD